MSDELDKAEALLACECGHGLDEHNGVGCYARVSYDPLVVCDCKLTDNRTEAELLAERIRTGEVVIAGTKTGRMTSTQPPFEEVDSLKNFEVIGWHRADA